MKIWDAHNHWMPPAVAEKTNFFQKGWSDIKLLLTTLDSSGIEKAVLLYPNSSAHIKMGGWSNLCKVYNQELAKQIKAYPDRLIGAGILPVDKPEQMPKEIDRIRDLGLSCLCLASSYDGKYLDDRVFLPVFQQAQSQGLPIFVHSQIINPIGFERIDDPLLMPVVEYLFDITMCVGKLMMSGIFSRLPEIKFAFAHFGGVLPFLFDRFDSTYSMLRLRNIVKDLGNLPSDILKNVFVDISGTQSNSILAMALEAFGPGRILWGSDFPAKKELAKSINTVCGLDINQSDKQGILSGNLKGLFRREDKTCLCANPSI